MALQGDLAQILDAFGMRPGELDPVRIGRARVDCKVYSPLRLIPSVVEVKDNRFPVSSIALRVSNGVEIIEAKARMRLIDTGTNVAVAEFEITEALGLYYA